MSTNKSVKNTSDTMKSFVDTKTLLIVPLIKETQSRKSLGDSLLRVASVETLVRKSLGDSLLRVASVETLVRKSLGDSLLRVASVETQSRHSLAVSLSRVAQVETLVRKSLGDSLLRVASVETLVRKSLGDSLLRVASVETQSRHSLAVSLSRVAQVETLVRKSLGDSLLRVASVETQSRHSLAVSLQRADTYEHFNYWKSMNGPRNTQSRGKSMLNHDELPKIKRLLRGIGKKHSTPYLEFEIHLNMKKGKYDPEARLTRYQLGVRFSTPDDVSHEETVRRASEINLSELIFETIREEYPDARIAKVRGQNGIYVPVLCGSLVLSDREYA